MTAEINLLSAQNALYLPDILAQVHFHHHNPFDIFRRHANYAFGHRPQGFQDQQANRFAGAFQLLVYRLCSTGTDAVGNDEGVGFTGGEQFVERKGFDSRFKLGFQPQQNPGNFTLVGGDVAVCSVGGRSLAHRDIAADGQKIGHALAFGYLKGQKGLAGGWGRSIDYVGYLKRIHIDAFPGHGNFLVGCDEHRTAKFFSQVKGLHGQCEAVAGVYRRQHNHRQPAAVAPAQKIDVAVRTPGGRPGGRPQSLHIDDHDGDFAADRKGNLFTVQADTRTGGRRHHFQPAHGGSEAGADGCDFIFCLEADATHRRQQAKHVV